jgi:CheY-like chemotaxis protein
MSLVLAIEPDPSQADIVRHMIRDRVSAELVLVASKDDALAAIDRQKPDLILVSALLSPRDEDELVAHLRALDDASHLQTLTIPQLRRPDDRSHKSSFFDSFRKRRPQSAQSGCDPKVFAEEVAAYLARARDIRHQRRTAAARTSQPVARESPAIEPRPPVDAPVPIEVVPPIDPHVIVSEPSPWIEDAATRRASARASATAGAHADMSGPRSEPLFATGSGVDEFAAAPDDTEPHVDTYAPQARATEAETPSVLPVDRASDAGSAITLPEPIDSVEEVQSGRAEPVLAELVEVNLASLLDPEPSPAEPVSALASADAVAEVERLINQLGVHVAKIETDDDVEPTATFASEGSSETGRSRRHRRKHGPVRPTADVTEVLAAEVARVQAEAEARLAAELERVRAEAERKRLDELAQLQAEAEALRQAAIGQVRLAAEVEAREALTAELARVRAEAEHTFADALNHVRAENEQTLAARLTRAREEAEQVRLTELARVRAETEQTLSAGLRRAREEAEQVRLTELARVRADADERSDAAARRARETAEADAAATFAAELARVRAEAEQTFAAQLGRVRTEAEQSLASQLGRARSEAEEVRLTEWARAEAEANQLRAAAAQEARTAAEAAARALEPEVARVRAEAEARLQAELERVRKAAEVARLAEQSEAKVQAHELREAAAREARAIAETAASRTLEAEIARVRADADARLAAELARVRADAEERRAAELDEIRAQVAEMREAAAQQARSAAAEAIAAEVARAAAESKQTIATRTRPNVVVLRPPAPTLSASGGEARPNEKVADARAIPAPAAAKTTRPFEEPTVIALAPDALPLPPKAAAEPLPTADGVATDGRSIVAKDPQPPGTDYYSLWRAQTLRPAPTRPDVTPEQTSGQVRRTWALPIAASLLLIVTDGMRIDMASWRIGAPDDAPIEAAVVAVPEAPAARPAPAAPEPAPPTRPVGEIRVESTPAAQVLLDGKMRGDSPLTLSNVPAGKHTLVLASDAGTVTRTITVRDGEMTAVVEAIIPGWLAVFSRIELDIYVGGQRRGTTEEGHLPIPPGRHEIQLVNERLGYRATEIVDIEPGKVIPHTVTLPAGIVHVNAVLGAEVWIEGELVGQAPLRDLFVPIGTREILVRHPDFGERRETVEVRFDVPTELTIELTR